MSLKVRQHYLKGKIPPPWKPSSRRLDGPRCRSVRFGREKKLLALSGIERRFLILPSLGLTTLSSILAPRVLIMITNFSSEQCLFSDG